MLYFKFENGVAVSAHSAEEVYKESGELRAGYQCRADWTTGRAAEIAADVAASLTTATGALYIVADSGPNVWPRYDVIRAPAIGDIVSKAFNGDSYPCGTVTAIGKGLKRITATDSDGSRTLFYKQGDRAQWLNNGTWSLRAGAHYSQNPSF